MATHEVTLGLQYIYATLSGSTDLAAIAVGGVHRGMAPIGTSVPFVVFAHQTGSVKMAFQNVKAYTEILYQVKAVGLATNTSDVLTCAGMLDGLLMTDTDVTVTGGVIKSCYPFQTLQLDEDVNGEQWNSTGALYLIRVKAT